MTILNHRYILLIFCFGLLTGCAAQSSTGLSSSYSPGRTTVDSRKAARLTQLQVQMLEQGIQVTNMGDDYKLILPAQLVYPLPHRFVLPESNHQLTG